MGIPSRQRDRPWKNKGGLYLYRSSICCLLLSGLATTTRAPPMGACRARGAAAGPTRDRGNPEGALSEAVAERSAASSRLRSALASRRADFPSGAPPGAAMPPRRRKSGSALDAVAGRAPLSVPPARSILLALRAASVSLSAS